MDTNFGATDLTMSDKRTESNKEASPPKRPKIELPFSSPSGSDNNAPVLEPVVPVPNFNLAEVAESYFATSTPPVLHPEIQVPSSSLAKDCQPSTSSSVKAIPQTASPAMQKPKESHMDMMPSFGLKNYRYSKVSSVPKKLDAILQKTINALKNNSDGFTQRGGRKEMVKLHTKDVPKIPRKSKGSRRSSTSVITPEQAKMLEARYAANPNPAPSEVHEIAEELNITTKDVKKWFTAHKKQVGVKTHDSPDSGFAGAPGTSANAMKSQMDNRRIVETSGLAGTSVPDANGHDHRRHDDIIQQTPDDKLGNVKLKFLRKPELRTDDLDVIKRDVENVKNCELNTFRALLVNNWEVKANRLLMSVTTEGFGFKKTIYKESRRLNRIAAFVDLVSEEQDDEVFKWKNKFIDKKAEEGKYGDYLTVKTVVEETVIPWIAPFMYSRTTLQDGRNLTMEVALHDFCKISDAMTVDTSKPIEWITPSLLQTDYDISNLPQ